MDTKTKILFSTVGVMLLIASALSYYRLVVSRDYMMHLYVPCDSNEESCFVGDCTDLMEWDVCYDPYKIIRRSAASIPRECDVISIDECPEIAECGGDPGCSVITCTDKTAVEEETECIYSRNDS